jgi:DNA-binding CsgD family transcriptional regulator
VAVGTVDWPLVGRDREVRELERVARHRSIVVSGAVGVGKSRLVTHVVDRLARAGATTIHVRVTRSSATVPFGPFAPWVPELGPDPRDRLHVLQAIARSLTAGEGPVVIAVDDAHLLDEGSAALLLHLVTGGSGRVVATVRSAEPCPDAVVALWKEGLADLIELAPLTETDTLELAARVLGGLLAGTTRTKLWALTGGAPLYLREVLRAALDQGVLTGSATGWRWDGDLDSSARLRQLTNDNLGRAEPDERRALELVAIGEPLPLEVIQELGLLRALERAQRKGLVSVGTGDDRATVRMAHPLYGELMRADVPSLATRGHLASLADAALRVGLQERDPLRVASWWLESGAAATASAASDLLPDVYLAAAHRALALTDWALAERLGRAAEAAGAGAQAALVRAAALVQLGGWGEADAALAGLSTGSLDGPLVAEYTRFRARNLILVEGDQAAGHDLLIGAAARLRGPARARVLVEAAYTAAFACDPADALRLAGEALDAAGPGIALRAQALAVAALAWTLDGHSTLALQATQAAVPHVAAVVAHDRFPGNAVIVLLPARCLSLALQGRLDEAAAAADAALSAGAGDDPDGSFRWVALSVRGRIALLQGRPALARQCALEALEAAGSGPASQWQAAIALAGAAQQGSTENRQPCADGVGAGPQVPLYALELTVACGWDAAARGELVTARSTIAGAAAEAARHGVRLFELFALLDLTRLGAGALAAPRLAALRSVVEGSLALAAADYAQAAATNDGDGLDEVSVRFEAMGALLVAAEAAAAASIAHSDAGRPPQHNRSRARSLQLAARCEGSRTPGLRLHDVDPLLAALTRREREVLQLAAQGLSNREIAARLYVSMRTVNAHLNHVYRKLGVDDRSELAAFAPPSR